MSRAVRQPSEHAEGVVRSAHPALAVDGDGAARERRELPQRRCQRSVHVLAQQPGNPGASPVANGP